MRLPGTCFLLLLAAACAAPRAERMSFMDALRQPMSPPAVLPEPPPPPSLMQHISGQALVEGLTVPQPPSRAIPPTRVVPSRKALARARARSAELDLGEALSAFVIRSGEHRKAVRRGAPMKPGQRTNWESILWEVDRLLARSPSKTRSLDVVRARMTLEAEYALDFRTYRRLPSPLSRRVSEAIIDLGIRVAEVRNLTGPLPRGAPALAWPLEGVAITSVFGKRLHPITGKLTRHIGVDLAAREGQAVFSAATGTVVVARWRHGHGKHVEIRHSGDWVTRYSHLSAILVEPGQRVDQGDPVGLAGATGRTTGVHLHFELWRKGRPLDPLDTLGKPPRQQPVAIRE